MERWSFMALAVLASSVLGCRGGSDGGPVDSETYTIERTDYTPPGRPDDGLVDDRLDSNDVRFDPGLTALPAGPWAVNLSDSILKLDVPMIRPDAEPGLATLQPSYASAIARVVGSTSTSMRKVLPSLNMVDGKAKQFDDGLYAAIDQAYYRGLAPAFAGHIGLVKRLLAKVGPAGEAAPFLAAGLELAGERAEVRDPAAKERWLAAFRADESLSRPIGFYTWNRTLSDAFHFLRFFQHPFGEDDLAIPRSIARALGEDEALLADYRKALTFHARLTNPPARKSFADLIGPGGPPPARSSFSMFPASTSKEVELFHKLFPDGLPPGADLMRELMARIRSGAVDLRPGEEGGWYAHQVYALETLLLPDRGEERARLLLTGNYKRRMVDAFQAMMTKRRETHVRQLEAASGAAAPLERLAPRLRVEPCPTFYLRTARSYTFLVRFLDTSVGEPALKSLHGLREGGERGPDLHSELASIRELFYGLYLVSVEDIGMKPGPLEGDGVDPSRCRQSAVEWLARATTDPDLDVDTRVPVPIYVDRIKGVTRLWATVGIRMAKLDASYARPPRIRPADGPGDWAPLAPHQLGSETYLIAVDDFAEVELKGIRVLTRAELRKACDTFKTKAAIVEALQK